jgi:acyl-CoA dehydrogenase
MIDFELPPQAKGALKMIHGLAEGVFRKHARYYDEHEHDEPEELKPFASMSASGITGGGKKEKKEEDKPKEKKEEKKGPGIRGLITVLAAEEMAWGDAGLMLSMPGTGLGNAAIAAVATDEQKARFGTVYAAMAITEPGAGSDSAAISTTAELDKEKNEWILNGEKIFVTAGERCNHVVVWATVDKSARRAGIKSFVVPKDTPGMKVTKLEHKLGIRASDTAAIVFEDCRIPYDNILGSAEVIKSKGSAGFKGVMATFDSTRPAVAAMALGVARAALEFTKQKLEEQGIEFRYGISRHKMTAVEKDMFEMESNLEAARLLNWRAASLMDFGVRNSLEASMAKAKAGKAATLVTQKCVELLGTMGYSREWLAEKWMRDCKINDIFEGTGQIQTLIVARHILGYGRDMLK